jgi:hypothetical protein
MDADFGRQIAKDRVIGFSLALRPFPMSLESLDFDF